MRQKFVPIFLSVLLVGCSTWQQRGSTANQRSSYYNDSPDILDALKRKQAEINPEARMKVGEIELENSNFDIPITLNTRVNFWVDYFTGRGRVHFEKYLERSNYFIPYIVNILRENKMPEDFVFLAMIESGFHNHARSTAKAVGPWQFIEGTGKRYGLGVNWWVDERRDTFKSTQAAVFHLRDLMQMYGSWELAAAAYNAGSAKINNAIRRYGTSDYWVMSQHRYLRQETRDYVPKIIAAAILTKNRTQFGFPPPIVRHNPDEAVAASGEIVKLDPELEPAVPLDQVPADLLLNQNEIEIADNQEAEEEWEVPAAHSAVPVVLDSGKETELARLVSAPHVNRNGETIGEDIVEVELRSPADLFEVARSAEISYFAVKGLNPELLRWCTPPNVSTYRIKLPAVVKDRFLRNYNLGAKIRKANFQIYYARKGDSLERIARRIGVKQSALVDLNGISPRAPIRVKTALLLPIPHGYRGNLVALDIIDRASGRSRRKKSPKNTRKTSSIVQKSRLVRNP